MSKSKGQLVKLKTNSDLVYLVIGETVNPLGNNSLSLVPFYGGSSPQTYDIDSVESTKWVGPIPTHLGLACLVAYDTFNPSTRIGHGVVAVNAIFKPHQFRPLLKFINDSRERILIADQTGLGKTVEAGYIISHEIMNGRASKILVICPSHLRQKWKDDLSVRFGIPSKKVSGQLLRTYIKNGFPPQFTWIISIDAARSLKDRIEYLDSETLDILIIDEVHNLIGRQGLTLRREFCEKLSSISRSVLGLSATPINIEETDLLRIMEIIRPGELDELSFAKELAINGLLNQLYSLLSDENWNTKSTVTLNNLLNLLVTLVKDIPRDEQLHLQKVISICRNFSLTASISERMDLRKEVVDANSFRGWMTRTTRTEANENRERYICKKVVPLDKNELSANQGISVSVSEESLYTEADELLKEYFSHVHRRQLSSCLYGTRDLIECGVNGYSIWKEDGFEIIDEVDYLNEQDTPKIKNIEKMIPPEGRIKCEEILRKFNLLQIDSKVEYLRTLLSELSKDEKITKCLIFTQWRPTIRHLQNEFIVNCEYPCFFAWGEQREYEREAQIQKFQSSNGFSVLFCSDILSEGIDLIEANCIINYDFPYNPQKIEQRIGRVDRIGQESDCVFSYSIVIENSLDETIHELLLERIKAFERGIGPLSAILTGQESVLKSMGLIEQEYLEKEFKKKWDLQNSPSLSVIDTPLEFIDETLQEEQRKNLESVYWLVLYPLLVTIVGSKDCVVSEDVNGINVRTDQSSRNTIATYWGVEKKDVMQVFFSDDNSVFISADEKIGRTLPITTELYRKTSEFLMNNVFNPIDGTLVSALPDNCGLDSNSEYYLIECRIDGYRGIERIFTVFREHNGTISLVEELEPNDLVRILLKNEGYFDLDPSFSERMIAKYNAILEHFADWIDDVVTKDRIVFSAKEPDSIRIIRNRIPALKRRLQNVKTPQEAAIFRTLIQEARELLVARESQLSSLMNSSKSESKITVRCILALVGGMKES